MNSKFNQQKIETLLLPAQGHKIKYVSNPGNAGDSLIAFATLQKLRELNLDFSIKDDFPNVSFVNT